MKKVATITLNPAYDWVGFCPEIEHGEVNRIQTAGVHAAGKGVNVAIVLKNLGLDVTVGGLLGTDNQEGFLQLFGNMGIENRFYPVAGNTRINVKLTHNLGTVTDLNFSGFTISTDTWQQFTQDSLSWLSEFDIVVVSGSLPEGLDVDDFSDWLLRLRQQCPQLVLDSSRQGLVAGLKAAPWLVKPNRRELEIWAGKPLPTLESVITAAQALRAQGINQVVVSLGEEGALWVNDSGILLAKPPQCDVVSTVGAGDSMVGGLVYGLLRGESQPDTLRLATALAVLAVSQSNVGISDPQQLAALMAEVSVTAINA